MKKVFLVGFLLKITLAVGQSVVYPQALYWIRYQNQLNITPKFYWINEIDNRRFFDPSVENQLIMHSRVHYLKDRWAFGAGLTFSWIYSQIPENGYSHSIAEVRPVIEGAYEFPVRKVLIQQRLRIDNRFIEESQDQSVWEDSFYIFRFRYRLMARIPLKVNDDGVTTIWLRLSEEIMLNNKENTFDQNRLYASTEFVLNKKLTLETGYIYIYQQRFGTEDFFSRHVVRFSIIHYLWLKSALRD
ncbi:MAG TPA: DUF2490 domain-containing protein [Chryseolinea sp.]|nr:DUF2490 domain-containing protein [Chryseolinea sp.]